MFEQMSKMGLQEIHFKRDEQSGLCAIIAVHNLNLGDGLGGCRFIEYPSTELAIKDAMRLAQGMSYKSALAGLSQGGAKSVIVKPKKIHDRTKLFEAFGDFVNEMGGRYITAVDSGTKSSDMDIIASKTKFVTSTSQMGDPSLYTAQGVFECIKTCLTLVKNLPNDLSATKIAVQGLGNVGYILCKLLSQAGATLFVSDIDTEKVDQCCREFSATSVKPEDIYTLNCDVFSPCGLGGILNEKNIKKLNCKAVIGSANNQLNELKDGESLHEKGILYAPDYLVNSGGLIFVSLKYQGHDEATISKRILNIPKKLEEIIIEQKDNPNSMSFLTNSAAQRILYPDMHS